MSDNILLDREMHRKIKRMDREEMNRVLNNIYENGRASAEATHNVDYDKIRSEISEIKGIGETRLEQIMEIIQRNV